MATLVLSTVGTMLGGPVGGAIGSLLGQSIDQQLLGPGPRHGPRLGDLSVQSSSYGSAIPKLFGTMRVAGSIVWSTDLQEQSRTETAKSQPETITYSYSASFAVALSSRRIKGVGRIWADGKLIRSPEGAFSVSTGFRVHDGSEDQQPDPLMASIEGIGSTPAYRGVALAVFENLELADFGNRIPFLTFEVIADPAPVAIGLLLAEASDEAIACAETATIMGFASYGTSIAAAVEPLVKTLAIPLVDDGSVLASPTEGSIAVIEEEGGCTADEDRPARISRAQLPSQSLPAELTLSYYDPERDYQTGAARASLESRSAPAEQIELPGAMHASEAKALAESSLARRWAERDRITLRLSPAFLDIQPATKIEINGQAGLWRVERLTLDRMVTVAELRPVYSKIGTVPADQGRVLPSIPIERVPTDLAIFELPDDGSGSATSPVVVVAAAGGTNWHPVPLSLEIGGLQTTARTARAATVMGTATTALGAGQSALIDVSNSVDVSLTDSLQWLESCDDDALCGGANLAIIGDEIFQFGSAVPLGNGLLRLTRLLRGRRGSEWAMGAHFPGERFALLDPARLLNLPLDRANIGAQIVVTPSGLGDEVPAPVSRVVSGEALKPPSPVHLRTSTDIDGNLHCTWVRRSGSGWEWLDAVDVPLGCAVERYRATLEGALGSIIREASLPSLEFSAAELSGVGSGSARLEVVQVGDFAMSHPAALSITIPS
jgi:hypothetical protein